MSTLSIDHTSTDPNNYLEHRLQGRDLIIELLDYSIIIRTVQLLNNAVIVVVIDQDLDLSVSDLSSHVSGTVPGTGTFSE